MMTKPAVILALEDKLQIQLHPAPTHGYDPVRNVMACRRDPNSESGWLAQYALHPDGTLAGLNLTGLGLKQWDVSDFPEVDFSRVEALNLRENALLQFKDIAEMPQLRYLDLSENRLEVFELPAGLEGLEHLWLGGNDFKDSVLKAQAQQGRFALLKHLRSLISEGSEELYEARMLIIGEPKAGKTSLRKKLQKVSNPLPTKSTEGIDVDIDLDSNSFPHLDSKGKKVTFHYQVWDFGGQRAYHPTHQLFFVKSTLYILVTNTDTDHKNEGDVEFWLETVQKLGEGSPVLRVENKPTDRDDSTDWKEINRRFGHMIHGVFPINLDRVDPGSPARYSPKEGKHFSKLKETIQAQLKGLEHVGSQVTPTWRKIRQAIANEVKKTPCISLARFQEICQQCGMTDPNSQLELSKTFHILGIFLHYQHNDLLNNIIILKNEWAIDAVFAILDSPFMREERGKFEKEDLPKIWAHPQYAGKEKDLLNLLQEFELCYPLDGKQGYVAPQCLAKTPPSNWGEWDETNNVRVDVAYDFLPRAVIIRLIVKMHEHIAAKKQWVWQSGVVLQGDALGWKDTQAYIQENYKEKKIAIRLRGAYSEDLFREIQSKLRDIGKDFPNLVVDYVIYCNCDDCKQTQRPTPFKYHQDLLRFRRELNLEEIQCLTKGKQVKIESILSGIISKAQAKEDEQIGQKSAKQTPADNLIKLVEDSKLREALQILKNEGEEVTILLSNLTDANKAYHDERIDFSELGKKLALIKSAILDLIR